MAHMQRPTLNISDEDYSIEILCTHDYQLLRYSSTSPPSPSTVFPQEITLRFSVETLLVSSSDKADRTLYQSTNEDIWVLSDELFSSRCGEAVEVSLNSVHIPFALADRNIDWCGIHIRPGPHARYKLLRSIGELVSEIVEYIGITRGEHSVPLEMIVVQVCIKKLVAQPAGVVASWRNWSRAMWREYYEFVFEEPMKYLRRKSLVKILETLRQQEGEFEPEEVCCICMEGLSEEEGGGGGGTAVSVTRLRCSHVYHESCILDWLVVQSSCPYCRDDIGDYSYSLHGTD